MLHWIAGMLPAPSELHLIRFCAIIISKVIVNLDKPKYLFHYTAIQTLPLILKSRRIRFNRLDKVDDLTEAETLEGKQLGQHYFISCWTDSQLENIKLWQMYTGFRGVRIRLQSDMFRTYELNGKDDEQYRIEKDGLYMNIRLPYRGPINVPDLLTNNYAIMPAFYGSDFLQKIQYTNEKNLLIPRVLYKEFDKTTISLTDFCKYKSIEWSFQSEWRFVLHISPIDKKARLSGAKRIGDILPTITKEFDFFLQDYYLDLKENIFNDLVILVGPKCSKGDVEIIETLVDKYAPKAVILSSYFTGKIK